MPEDALHVKEMWIGIFYIWPKASNPSVERSTAPLAICTHVPETRTWIVELNSGEKLGLYDNNNVWDIAKDDDGSPLVYGVKKKYTRRHRRKRK